VEESKAQHWLVTRSELELAKLASKDDPRLASVAISATRTEVTNGHYAVRLEGPRPPVNDYPALADPFAAPNGQVLIDRETALAIAKAIPKKTDIPILANAIVGQDKITVTDLGGWITRTINTADLNFPNLDKVMPPKPPKVSITLNAAYVVALMQAFIAQRNRIAAVKIDVFDPEEAIRISMTTDDDRVMTAILMPMRD
jgi:hypothetical protein